MDLSNINWMDILPKFGVNPNYLSKKHGPCPFNCPVGPKSKNGGRKRFRFDDRGGYGTWICSTCGAGNGFMFLQKFTGMADEDIFNEINRYTNGALGKEIGKFNFQFSKPAMTEEEIAQNRQRLQRAWRDSRPITAKDPAGLYLLHRVPGLRLEHLSGHLRYNPGMMFYENDSEGELLKRGMFPTLLARVVDAQRKPVTAHRTYLTKEGRKAPFENVKKQMSGTKYLEGEAIHLNDVQGSRELAVCEGIETGLALVTAHQNRINVWSFLNCHNLGVGKIPRERFDHVIIYMDKDEIDQRRGYRPGEHYGQMLGKKLMQEGFKVTLKVPDEVGVDFADLWERHYAKSMNKVAA